MQYAHSGGTCSLGAVQDQEFSIAPASTHDIACKPLPCVFAPLGLLPRIHRSVARTIVKRDTDPDATVLPIMREVSDEWSMAKDGRSWFGHHLSKLMRK